MGLEFQLWESAGSRLLRQPGRAQGIDQFFQGRRFLEALAGDKSGNAELGIILLEILVPLCEKIWSLAADMWYPGGRKREGICHMNFGGTGLKDQHA